MGLSNRKTTEAKVALVIAVSFAILALVDHSDPPDPRVLRPPFNKWGEKGYSKLIPLLPFSHAPNKISTIEVYEDGKLLGPSSEIADIEAHGNGRFRVWVENSAVTTLFFSTSDNSDPNTNGRTYRVADPMAVDPYPR
jgi:hypothetical protein